MSWDRRLGRTEGLPNGRIGETSRYPGLDAGRLRTSPKAKYDEAESRVTMRVRVEDTDERGLIGFAQIGMFRAIRRSADLNSDGQRNPAPPKERK